MKKLKISLWLVIISQICFSQNNYTGDTLRINEVNMGTRNVISDFGPRLIPGYNWHGGIDYTVEEEEDLGYSIHSVEAGTIERVRGGAGQKYMIIDDLMYNHMFSSATLYPLSSGNFEFVKLKSYSGSAFYQFGIIHYENNDTTLLAACSNGDCSNSYYLMDSDTLFANNQVEIFQAIGPVGTSSGTNSNSAVASHVHLQKFNTGSASQSSYYNKSNLLDPLESVSHEGPDYEIKLLHDSGVTNIDDFEEGVLVKYGDSLSTILVRPIMPDSTADGMVNNGFGQNSIYFNNTMNIDILEVELKRDFEHDDEYEVIQGPSYELKMELGASEDDNEHYPNNLLNAGVGSWSQTGIHPYAYSTNQARRWDDFYLTDFQVRVHNENILGENKIADLPNHARYMDGNINIRSKVIDIRGDSTVSDGYSLNLDNFKPFIQSVQIDYDGISIYEKGWEDNDPSFTTINDGYIQQGSGFTQATDEIQLPNPGDILINAKSSEPLIAASVIITDLIGYEFGSYPGNALNDDQTLWQFEVPYIDLPYDSCFQLNFNGIDFNYNNLLDLEEGERNFIPKRQNTLDNQDTWSVGPEEDLDRVHQFCIKPCGNRSNGSRQDCLEENEIEVSVLPASSNAINDGSITLNIPSGASDLDVVWTELDSDTEIGDGTNILSKRLPGIYCWEFEDPECCIKWSNCHEVKNCEDNTPITLVTNPKCRTLEIELSVSGGIEPYTFEWREGQNPNGQVLDVNKNFIASLPGEYCVEVTDACGQLEMICQEVGINLSQNLTPEIFDYCNGVNGYGSINLLLQGNTSEYSFHWDTGDESSYITGLESGEYCVTISNKSNCSATRCYTIEENFDLEYEVSNSCYGQSNGSIELLNLYPGAEIEWDNGLSGINIDGLDAGTYCYHYNTEACGLLSDCIIIDNDCCNETTINTGIDQPSGFDLDVNHICENGQSGSMYFTFDSQLLNDYPLPYRIEIENSSDGSYQTIDVGVKDIGSSIGVQDLSEGDYEIIIWLSDNCRINIEEELVSQNCEIEGEVRNETCDESGGIELSIDCEQNTDASQMTFIWNDGSAMQNRDNLLAGNYSVTITDNYGCTYSSNFEVEKEECECEIEIYFANVNRPQYTTNYEQCAQYITNDGSITIGINPPSSNYLIEWSNGESGYTISGLAAGTYNVTVSNSECSVEDEMDLWACAFMIPSESGDDNCEADENDNWDGSIEVQLDDISQVTDAEPCSGSIDVSFVYDGNYPVVDFYWELDEEFFSTSEDLENLCVGEYCIILDGGCNPNVVECFNIINCEDNPIQITGNTTSTCDGYEVGEIDVTVSGGTPPFTFIWSNGSNDQNLSELTSGEYFVTVLDANFCNGNESFIVGSQDPVPNRCEVICNGEVVRDWGPEIRAADPIQCEMINTYCSLNPGLGIIGEPEDVGTYIDFEAPSCYIAVKNIETDEICPGYEENGQTCTTCLFGRVPGTDLWYNCQVEYCSFPSIGGVYIYSVEDFQQFVVRVGDIGSEVPGKNCFLQVYNNCESSSTIAFEKKVLCDENISFDERSCFFYLQEHINNLSYYWEIENIPDLEIFFGVDPCNITSSPEFVGGQINPKMEKFKYYSSQQVENPMDIDLLKYSDISYDSLYLDDSDICERIILGFTSDRLTDTKISLVNYDNPSTNIELDYLCKEGNNQLILEYNTYENLGNRFEVRINFKEQNDLVRVVEERCEMKDNKVKVKVFPNPATNILNLEVLSSSQSNDILGFEIYSTLGKLATSGNVIQEALSVTHTLDISQLANGTYFISFYDKQGFLTVEKFIKHSL